MAIQTQGFSGIVPEVDTTFRAQRLTVRPQEVVSWLSAGAPSGALTGAAANTAVFSFRNLAANLIVVRRIGVGYVTTTAFTTAQQVDFGLMVARSFTASDTGGTAIAFTGSNCKHRTSLTTPTSLDCRIATTGALTAGTKTLDTNHISQTGGFSSGAGAGLAIATNNLLSHDTGDYPLVLAQNEGFNVMNLTALGAAGVIKLYVNIEFAEAAAY